MIEEKIVYLHIGTHKTGTTSIQNYMLDNYERYSSRGLDFYRGMYLNCNHVELHMAAMRDDRTSPFKMLNHISVDLNYRMLIQERVQGFLRNTTAAKVVFSAEGLSFLRYDDELSALKKLFDGFKVYVILYLRNKASFLNSYTQELLKAGLQISDNPASFAYVNSDTWLTDYESLIRGYGKFFGWDHLTLLSYENALRNDGTILPSFLSAIGECNQGSSDTANYWLNKTPSK